MSAFERNSHCLQLAERRCSAIILQSGHRKASELAVPSPGPVNHESLEPKPGSYLRRAPQRTDKWGSPDSSGDGDEPASRWLLRSGAIGGRAALVFDDSTNRRTTLTGHRQLGGRRYRRPHATLPEHPHSTCRRATTRRFAALHITPIKPRRSAVITAY